MALNGSAGAFTAISATGHAVWLDGDQVTHYQVSTTGAIPLGVEVDGKVYGSATVGSTLQRLAGSSRTGHPFELDAAAVGQRSVAAEALLRTALCPASDPSFGTPPAAGNHNPAADPRLMYTNPLNGAAAFNSLAQQFQVVARMIDASISKRVGMRRQVFFLSMGGFDTHDGQNRVHADLYAHIDQALK
jgi:uncharacterized protein (DUF1501 family)